MSGVRKKRRGWGFLSIVVIAVVVVGWYARSGGGFGSGTDVTISGAPVERGSLRISVVERGNLKAAESVKLTNEMEGRTTILSLIEEGTSVEPGDILCQLDTSSLEERLQGQEISVQNAEASFVKAKQNHAIQVSSNESDIARAERDLAFAKMDREKYEDGDWKQELSSANESIFLAREELQQSQQDYEWSQKLAEKGFLEALQLESDRLKMERAKIKLAQSERALELLEKYEYKRRSTELEADVVEAQRELERTKLQATARLADFDADLRTSEARYALEKDELDRIHDQIGKAVLKAPVAGMVVYARERSHRMGSSEPIQEGTEIRERQEIITIPSAKGMVVEASLHESVLEKVKIGMPCLVSVDAVPGRSFPGRVTFKAVLPDQNSWWANPDLRVYRTEVEVLDDDPRMRPGMSCSLEILVEEIENTLYMPLQSVFLDGGETVCFVKDDGGIASRSIEVGQNNGRWVQVAAGLEEGETVLLSMPPGFNLLPAPEQENSEESMEDWPESRVGPDTPSGAPGAGMAGGMPGGMSGGMAGGEGGERPQFDRAAYDAMSDEEKAALRAKMQKRSGGADGAGGSGAGERGGMRGEGGGGRRGEGGGGRGNRGGGGSESPSEKPAETERPSDSE